MQSLIQFEKLDEHVVQYNDEPYVSLVHLGSVMGWNRDDRKYKQKKLIKECDIDEELIIAWNIPEGSKVPLSTPNLGKLLKGRRVGYFVNHEGTQQLLQWENKYPHAKAFRKFVRKSMKTYMTTGRLVAQEQTPQQALEYKKLELDYKNYKNKFD